MVIVSAASDPVPFQVAYSKAPIPNWFMTIWRTLSTSNGLEIVLQMH